MECGEGDEWSMVRGMSGVWCGGRVECGGGTSGVWWRRVECGEWDEWSVVRGTSGVRRGG